MSLRREQPTDKLRQFAVLLWFNNQMPESPGNTLSTVFAGKLKTLRSGIARIRVVGRNWQRLAFPEPQNSRSKDRCDVDQSLLVASARNVRAVGHG